MAIYDDLVSGRPLSGDISEGPVVADCGVSCYISIAHLAMSAYRTIDFQDSTRSGSSSVRRADVQRKSSPGRLRGSGGTPG